MTKHIIKAGRNIVRKHHDIKQGDRVGWEPTEGWVRKHRALGSEHTALVSSYFASWSLAVNTVMPVMQRDLGNLTSLYMQPVATAWHLCAGLHINVSASSTVFYGLFQTVTVKYIFRCISMCFRF